MIDALKEVYVTGGAWMLLISVVVIIPCVVVWGALRLVRWLRRRMKG